MNVVVITARLDSERLPGKALIDLGGKPNLLRQIERFQKCKRVDEIIVATSNEKVDDAITDTLIPMAVQVFRGDKDDVLGRVLGAVKCLNNSDKELPRGTRILRATTDCPFISWELVDLAFDLFKYYPAADTARLWGLGERVPVYGSGEFPVSLSCLERMDKQLKEMAVIHEESTEIRIMEAREHVTSDIDAYRLGYQVVYPLPPRRFTEVFYRPYRLELDTPQDLELVNKVISELGINPSLQQVVRYLDANTEVAQINSEIMEKTGPGMYSLEQRARWKSQQSINTVEWRGDWAWLNDIPEIPKDAKPLYCRKGCCYLGYVKRENGTHVLYVKDRHKLTGLATLNCECGAGRIWREG